MGILQIFTLFGALGMFLYGKEAISAADTSGFEEL